MDISALHLTANPLAIVPGLLLGLLTVALYYNAAQQRGHWRAAVLGVLYVLATAIVAVVLVVVAPFAPVSSSLLDAFVPVGLTISVVALPIFVTWVAVAPHPNRRDRWKDIARSGGMEP